MNNDLGNLLNRLLGMAKKYFNHSLKSTKITAYYSKELEKVHQILDNANSFVPKMQLHKALEELFNVYDFLNKLIAKERAMGFAQKQRIRKTRSLIEFDRKRAFAIKLFALCVHAKERCEISECFQHRNHAR